MLTMFKKKWATIQGRIYVFQGNVIQFMVYASNFWEYNQGYNYIFVSVSMYSYLSIKRVYQLSIQGDIFEKKS